jgi:integrase
LYLTGNKTEDRKTIHLAEQIKARRTIELNNSRHGFNTDYSNASFFVFADTVKKTKGVDYSIRVLYTYCNGKLLIKDLTPNKISKFRAFLLENYKVNSASTIMHGVKSVIKKAVADELIEANLLNNIQGISMKKTNRVYLDIDEVRALHECRSEKKSGLCDAFLFSCFTGLRISDIKRLEWKNIQKDVIMFQQKKTREYNRVPLSEQALKYLPPVKTEGLVFEFCEQPIYFLNIWARKAGINKHITFHTARHTFATLAFANGADIYTVSKLLGHTDLKSTLVYAKMVDEKLKKAMDQMPTF